MSLLATLWAYRQAHALKRSLHDRSMLEAYQAKKLSRHLDWLVRHSPYFAQHGSVQGNKNRAKPLGDWPMMDKASMMAHFDSMNTAGVKRQQAFDLALRAEANRDFSPTLARSGLTVGLSSGTSAMRGLFLVSAREQAHWAGVMLAKALPDGLLAHERVALFLRANSNLYRAVQNRWISFRFFDLSCPMPALLDQVQSYAPTIVVAPAQVLRGLAQSVASDALTLQPKRVISVAEVLEADDREVIRTQFPDLHEIYQATEGFLASTCEHGVLHLNEEYLHVEPEWLDSQHQRFVPVITDFTRRTQPIIRYRLNDVLVARSTPCACGRPGRALAAIEGRCDDMLQLPAANGQIVTVYADAMSRALARALPLELDYRLQQCGDQLQLEAALDSAQVEQVVAELRRALDTWGIDTDRLTWRFVQREPEFDPMRKRRRIVRVNTQVGRA